MFRYLNFHRFSVDFFPEQRNFSLSHDRYGILMDQVTLILRNKMSGACLPLSDYNTVVTDSETTKAWHDRGKDNQTFYIRYTDSREMLPPIEIQICLGKDEITLRVVSDSDAYDCFEWRGVARFGENQGEDVLAVIRRPVDGIMNLTVGPAVPPGADALFNRKNDARLCFSGEAGLYFDYAIGAYRFEMRTDDGTVRVWTEKDIVSNSMCVNYRPMRKPLNGIIPCGFMTWYALRWDTCEKTVVDNIKAQAKLLKKFGANTIWIDYEWYHNKSKNPQNCDSLNPDPNVYPRGLMYIADVILENGMIPAIWCSPTHDVNENEYLRKYPDMLLIKQKRWCGEYFFDPTNPHFLQDFIPAVFNNVKNWGYRAVKWDTLPTSLDFYDDYHDRFADPSISSENALRNALIKAREVLGDDVYLLSCAGVNDRTVTACSEMFDAARIGSDIFDWKEYIQYGVARMMKFYPMHNTMLLCDPDNLVLREEFNSMDQAISRASLYSIMGAPINIGDDLTQLSEQRLGIYQKILPAVRVRPTELEAKELNTDVLILNSCIQTRWEHYHVVDVFNTTENEIQYTLSLSAIGKKPGERVLVYDFWNEKFMGICDCEVSLTLPPYASVVLAIRGYEGRPQLVSVSRHILQGACEITNMKWENETLSGEVGVAANAECKLRFYVPDGYAPKTTEDITINPENGLIELTVNRAESGNAAWTLAF